MHKNVRVSAKHIFINGTTRISINVEIKYLGVIYDSRLSFKSHVKNNLKKA